MTETGGGSEQPKPTLKNLVAARDRLNTVLSVRESLEQALAAMGNDPEYAGVKEWLRETMSEHEKKDVPVVEEVRALVQAAEREAAAETEAVAEAREPKQEDTDDVDRPRGRRGRREIPPDEVAKRKDWIQANFPGDADKIIGTLSSQNQNLTSISRMAEARAFLVEKFPASFSRIVSKHPGTLFFSRSFMEQSMSELQSVGFDALKIVNDQPQTLGLKIETIQRKINVIERILKFFQIENARKKVLELAAEVPTILNYGFTKIFFGVRVLHLLKYPAEKITRNTLILLGATRPRDIAANIGTVLEQGLTGEDGFRELMRLSALTRKENLPIEEQISSMREELSEIDVPLEEREIPHASLELLTTIMRRALTLTERRVKKVESAAGGTDEA